MKTPHDDIETASGMLLAHTSLITAVLAIMKEKGLFKQADLNEIFDTALIATESSTKFTPHSTHVARQYLESLSASIAAVPGPRQK